MSNRSPRSEFWETHLSISEAAVALGTSRQNVFNQVKRGTIPSERCGAIRGIPEAWVEETLALRNRDKAVHNA